MNARRHDEMDLEDIENYLLGESLLEATREEKEEKIKKSKKKNKLKSQMARHEMQVPPAMQGMTQADHEAFLSLKQVLESKGSAVDVMSYDMSEDYKVGAAIQHPVFGLGFVTDRPDRTKAFVLFENKKTLLICNQPKKNKKTSSKSK